MTQQEIGTSEIEALRARVAELEAELAEQTARTNAALARAQDRLYWLDRLNMDLNVTMRRPLVRLLVLLPLKIVRRARYERGRLQRKLG